jgi:hypothetical protein
MEADFDLCLLPRGQPHPRFSTMTHASRSTTPMSAIEIFRWNWQASMKRP